MEDYLPVAKIWNESFTNDKRSKVEWWLRDKELNTDSYAQRWVAEVEGVILGVSGYETFGEEYFQPHHYLAYLTVHPVLRGLGVGKELYRRLMLDIGERDPESVYMWTRADYPEGLGFLTKEGFREVFRMQHGRLEAAYFSNTTHARFQVRADREGYSFQQFADHSVSPQFWKEFYNLYCELKSAVPAVLPWQAPTFDDFITMVKSNISDKKLFFTAHHRGEIVGICLLYKRDIDEDEYYTELLGVTERYRWRGVGIALSLFSINKVMQLGSRMISQDNFVGNRSILPVLQQLGFIAEPDWILYEQKYTTEDE